MSAPDPATPASDPAAASAHPVRAAPGRAAQAGWTAAFVAVLLVALNLRAPFTSVGPVLADIRVELGLSGAAAALITGLPVLCLGLLAPVAPVVSRRFGIEGAIGVALVVLAGGLLLRATDGYGTLVVGTILVGGAIALANVLLPVIVKRDFPGAAGRVTGLYTTAMGAAAAMAAAVTIPAGEVLGIGWRGGIAIWVLLVLVALIAWLPGIRSGRQPAWSTEPGTARAMIRDPLAWQVTFYLSLQSLGFYTIVAWLPSIYRDHGMDPVQAGLLSALVPLGSIVGGLTVPARAGRSHSQSIAAFGVAAATAVGMVAIMVAPMSAPIFWVFVVGTGQGAGFPLALTLIVMRTRLPHETQQLSAMAQTVGYLVASTGPVMVGGVHDLTGGWFVPLGLLALLTLVQAVLGLAAGRPLYVRTRAVAKAM